jgi:hypothetical protein
MSDPKRALCFDPAWKYTPSGSTDIKRLFDKVRRQMKAEAAAPAPNVKPLRKVAK